MLVNYSIDSLIWKPNDSTFKGKEKYTAKVRLTAKHGYRFTNKTAVYIDVGNVKDRSASNQRMDFNVVFPDSFISLGSNFAESGETLCFVETKTIPRPFIRSGEDFSEAGDGFNFSEIY